MDNYRVISEEYLRRIVRGFAGNDSMTDACMEEIKNNSLPAQELWDAAIERHVVRNSMMALSTEPLYNNLTDFLTTKFPNND